MLDPEDLPLAGVVVLDFSQFLAGPVAALRLADLGARVIKVERPVTGEIGRTLAFAGRWRDGDTLSFHAMNRNKESVVADLKDPRDLERVRALVARADVVVQNFRPGVMARLGLDPATVLAAHPHLVYASASGYGDQGPWARRPGQDLLAQSVSGLPWVSSTGSRPVPVGLAIADHLMSCQLALGVTALLVRQARTGRGGLVETSLLEAMLDLQTEGLTARLNDLPTGREPEPALAGVYATADGHLALTAVPPALLARCLDSPALGALAEGSWWTRRDEVDREVRDRLATAPTTHWLETLGGEGVWCAPVLTLEELVEHPAFEAVGMTQSVTRDAAGPDEPGITLRTVRSPIRIDGERLLHPRGAPRLGAQGRADVDALGP